MDDAPDTTDQTCDFTRLCCAGLTQAQAEAYTNRYRNAWGIIAANRQQVRSWALCWPDLLGFGPRGQGAWT